MGRPIFAPGYPLANLPRSSAARQRNNGRASNYRFERWRGRIFNGPGERVDDPDKSASFDAGDAPRRSTSSLADVGKVIVVVLAVVSVLLIGALSWYLYISKDARRLDSAQFAIAFRKDLGQCTVSLRDFSRTHAMVCESVEVYIRDQLKLPPGARFVIFDVADSPRVEIDLLGATLQQRGYRLVGRLSAMISEPANDR